MNKKVKRVRMPSAFSIVARSYPDQIIGVDNSLPWHLRTDLQLFRKRTVDHAVIMGRKTFESIGRPLPNRTNIILSRTEPDFLEKFPSLKWAQNPETALFIADVDSIISGKMQFFIIGGDQIYKVFGSYINTIFVTDVYCGHINGDAKFDVDFGARSPGEKGEWMVKWEEEYPKTEFDEYPFRVTRYNRRKPFHRYRVKEELMGRVPDFDELLEQYELKLALEPPEDQLDLFD
ncbi:dihydrofolate reductase [Rhizobium sp. CB3171]|uniref:dihydrofolate reductase n=1 Tax=Rhizobium sp. CB3171 TaxID=3039157 RepID=UPI0024B22094|nr:dihydrofolate reductase [Rhizobium sp. CB3171]WFU03830.1 dihydrofolate reductase [Rhizobium sp. CB3171]